MHGDVAAWRRYVLECALHPRPDTRAPLHTHSSIGHPLRELLRELAYLGDRLLQISQRGRYLLWQGSCPNAAVDSCHRWSWRLAPA